MTAGGALHGNTLVRYLSRALAEVSRHFATLPRQNWMNPLFGSRWPRDNTDGEKIKWINLWIFANETTRERQHIAQRRPRVISITQPLSDHGHCLTETPARLRSGRWPFLQLRLIQLTISTSTAWTAVMASGQETWFVVRLPLIDCRTSRVSYSQWIQIHTNAPICQSPPLASLWINTRQYVLFSVSFNDARVFLSFVPMSCLQIDGSKCVAQWESHQSGWSLRHGNLVIPQRLEHTRRKQVVSVCL